MDVNTSRLVAGINKDLETLSQWFKSNLLTLNTSKSTFMIFTRKAKGKSGNVEIRIDNTVLDQSNYTKFLGVFIDDTLQWTKHISHVKSKVSGGLYALNKLKHVVPKSVLQALYYTLIHPYITYGCILWGDAHRKYLKSLITLQKKAIRLINNANYNSPTSNLFKTSNILKLKDIHQYQVCQFMFLIDHKTISRNILNKFEKSQNIHHHNTRQGNFFRPQIIKIDVARRSILHHGHKMWLALSNKTRQSTSVNSFKFSFKKSCVQGY